MRDPVPSLATIARPAHRKADHIFQKAWQNHPIGPVAKISFKRGFSRQRQGARAATAFRARRPFWNNIPTSSTPANNPRDHVLPHRKQALNRGVTQIPSARTHARHSWSPIPRTYRDWHRVTDLRNRPRPNRHPPPTDRRSCRADTQGSLWYSAGPDPCSSDDRDRG